jgi:hypothetical protein
MTRPGKIVAVLASLGGLAMGAALLAQQPPGAPAPTAKEGLTGKALIEARLATARDVYHGGINLWQHDRADLADAPLWSRRWMDEELRLAADQAARLAAIAAHLDRVRSIEKVAESRKAAARGTEVDVLKARYYRLEAEEMLADARANPGAAATTRPSK